MVKDIPKTKKTKQKELDAIQVFKKRNYVNLALGIILVIIILSSVSIFYVNSVDLSESKGFLKKIFEKNNEVFPKPDEFAAIVNQDPITLVELNDRYELLPQEYKQFLTKEQLLEQMIDELILLQEAEKLSFSATEEEIDLFIVNLLEQNQRTMEEFVQSLELSGLTMEETREFYKKSIVLNKLVNYSIMPNVEVSDVDVQDYYYSNPDQFMMPGQINVSHILICHNESLRCVSNLSIEEALIRVKEVKSLINESNFGEIALANSDEPGAQNTRGNLGWVDQNTPLDQTFMQTTMSLSIGEVSVPVETAFGFHIIKVFDKKESELVSLDEVYDQLELSLTTQEQNNALLDYISVLRNESIINLFVIE